ncbi:hypothetical protein [Spiroplasma endosymbiont of Nebria brevicollis]|uniref:hypothetical protein n=1 Tax=Spiroplasma endosymbiont of Nebria brevicollis TaxID=3066284 RepID=UPI00313EA864
MKSNKIIIVTGAGFSVPANLPVQESIINKLLSREEENMDFMNSEIIIDDSVNFLKAYMNIELIDPKLDI